MGDLDQRTGERQLVLTPGDEVEARLLRLRLRNGTLRPEDMELAEWLADRVRMPGLRAPLATLLGRALSNGSRAALGATWTDPPVAALGTWPGTAWQEVARLADLAANREAMGRLLVRRNPAGAQAIRAMDELLGASEDEFRERAGWEWVLEAAVRRAESSSGSSRS